MDLADILCVCTHMEIYMSLLKNIPEEYFPFNKCNYIYDCLLYNFEYNCTIEMSAYLITTAELVYIL